MVCGLGRLFHWFESILWLFLRCMTKLKTSEKWIEAGYECFAQEGPFGIQVERLARIVGLNKSGFYHYFDDHDTYMEKLVEYHYKRIHQFVSEVRTLKTFDPEYLELIVKYKMTAMVQMQLGRNRNIVLFSKAFADLNTELSLAVAPLW